MWCFPLYTGLPGFDLTTSATSLARGHMGGGGRLGIPGVGIREPRHGPGGPYTRKKFFRTQVQIHIEQPQIRKEVLTPPHPPPPKKGYPGMGGYRGQN